MKTTYISKQPNLKGFIEWESEENLTWEKLITSQNKGE
jgi:hypothetical protein